MLRQILSIFISHDRPDAEHTWEAEITVPSEYTVLMSGEANSISESLYTKTFRFKSTIATPISTLAIALGIFGTVSVNNWCKIYGPAMLLSKIHLSTLSYINQSLEEIQKLLGPIPFSQWDIVIVPRCFSNLGFSSPYLAIVSPSTVIGKGLVSKISHEAIHLWYGCSVGLCNWNEDWFTEGIATYFEEYIHKIVLKKLGVQDYQEIAQIRKYMILKRYFDECSNEGTELDRKYIHFLTKESGDYVADGLAYSRSFSQYHYVTGYLIFDKLVCQIGSENFVKFVRTFAENNASRSVLAGDFFQGIKNLYDVPEDLYEIESSRQLMQIHKKVLNELNIKKVIDRILRCLSDKKKRKMADLSKLSNQYESEPLCYLLDMILDWNVNKIRCHSQLDSLVESCKSENGEVRHRICEVILKYDLKRHCDFITEFLGDFQSLGVYVYNEMWLSAKHWQKHLCRKVYNQLIDEYDHSTKLMLQDIMK
ncbi:hypothetical protein QYM36_002779 [Artemia franciscana]|uniref:Peptidase M1 leukotriene A4 hydrolase/aminopeptidase C-terminal domain-containing protein n=1 Tax=Artemia franciscana TaxID=6661 RepID=A0AA88IDP5_ARTSF|nr:hypothetical protein QYM36_002779 [Artemia franciscana]